MDSKHVWNFGVRTVINCAFNFFSVLSKQKIVGMQAPLEDYIESETYENVQNVQKLQTNQIYGETWIQNMCGVLACVWL